MHYLIPFLVSCVCAVTVVNISQPSIFEMAIFLRQLHFMPNILVQSKIRNRSNKFKKIIEECNEESCLKQER